MLHVCAVQIAELPLLCVLHVDRAQEIRAERQRKALEAQQAEQRRLEEERFDIA